MNRQMRRLAQRKNNLKPQPVQATNDDGMAKVRAWDIPFYRQQIAAENGCEKNLAFVTYGGLGDVLCCEPTVRYTCEVLKKALGLESVTVITRYPDIFSHLDVEILKTSDGGTLEIAGGQSKYHFLYCGHAEGNLQHAFFTHNSMLPVDYPAVSSIRTQLPLRYRTIKTSIADTGWTPEDKMVYIHAGSHWESKRFSKKWWDEVLNQLCYRGMIPVLIGGAPSNDDSKPGTVDVNTAGCLDLRAKLSIAETAEHLHKAKVLLTNDSFPLHLATIGKAHIGFLATAKDPEWLMHYRMNEEEKMEFGWRMQDLALGGSYQRSFAESRSPNKLSKATPEEVASWLPDPKFIANWVENRA